MAVRKVYHDCCSASVLFARVGMIVMRFPSTLLWYIEQYRIHHLSSPIPLGRVIWDTKLIIKKRPFQPLDRTAVANHVWRDADQRPAIEGGLIILLAIFFEAFRVGVAFAVAGFGLHPDAAFHLAGDELVLPTKVKAPLAIGMEAIFQARLGQVLQPDLIQEHIAPVDLAADCPILATAAEFHT